MTSRLITILIVLCMVAGAAPLTDAQMQKQWSYNAKGDIESMTCFANRVYAAKSGGKVMAINIDSGNPLWETKVSGGGVTHIAVSPKMLYAVRGKMVTAIIPGTGKIKIARAIPIKPKGMILGNKVINERLIIQTTDQTHLVDPLAGKILFTADHPQFFGEPARILASKAWLCSFDESRSVGYFADKGFVKAINLKTGKVQWKTESPMDVFGALTIYDNQVYAIGPKVMFALDAGNGKILWVDKKFTSYKAESPYILFTPSRTRFTAEITGGFVTHHMNDKGRNYHYFIPDSSTLMFTVKSSYYFLYVYKEEESGDWHSMIFRQNYKTAQLHGHSDVKGAATGLWTRTRTAAYPELVPGTVFQVELTECEITGSLRVSGEPLKFIDSAGHRVVAADKAGKIIAIKAK